MIAKGLQTDRVASTRIRSSAEWTDVPKVSRFLLNGFQWYIPRMFRRSFNSFRIAKNSQPSLPPGCPAVCYLNHPGWWDPLVAHILNEWFLDGRVMYAPIDESALRQYPVFRKLGFFGVDLASTAGAKQFLTVMRSLLRRSDSAVWVTPGGAFSDVREPTVFQPGLGHVLAKSDAVALLPVAIEYPFWEERTPEVLVEFGPVTMSDELSLHRKEEWTDYLSDQLTRAQASLAAKAVARDETLFDELIRGRAGVGGGYDGFRRLVSAIKGERFDPRHRRDRQVKRVDDV